MSNDYLQETAEMYTQLAIGENVHVPLNMIFQGVDAKRLTTHAAGVFQFKTDSQLIQKLLCGAKLYDHHVMIIGDAYIRTKIVVQSKHLTGNGIGWIYQQGFADVDSWIKQGKILKGTFE